MKKMLNKLAATCLVAAAGTAAYAVPANDTICTATDVSAGLSTTATVFAIADANTATDDADNSCNAAANTASRFGVWFKYTATVDTNIRVQETSTNDIDISAWQGADCTTATQIAAACTTSDDTLFTALAGQTYYIMVSMNSATTLPNATGYSVSLSAWTVAANDVCSGASVMSFPFSETIDQRSLNNDADITCNSGTNGATMGAWYTFTAAADATYIIAETSSNDVAMQRYDGGCGVLTPGTCTDTPESITINATMGTTYHILVSRWTGAVITFFKSTTYSGATTPFTVTGTALLPPDNDDCETATAVTMPFTGTVEPRAADANDDISCNDAANTQLRRAVFYSFTPSLTGNLIVNETSANDIVFALYEGSCGSLTEVGCNAAESATFSVVSGTPYVLAVGMFSATAEPTAPYALNFDIQAPPTNDTACGAEVVGALPYVPVSQSGVLAGDDVDGPCNSASNTATRRGVWFSYAATSNTGIVVTDTSSNDTVMSVFTGPDCNTLTEVMCNDDADGLGFPVTSGQTYWVLVGMWSPTTVPTTPYALTFTEVAAPANDTCATAETIVSGGSSSVDPRAAGSDSPVATCAAAGVAFGTRHGVWYTYTTGLDPGTLNVNETGTSTVIMQLFTGTCGSLSPVSCTVTQNANFTLAPSTTYYLNMGFSSVDDQPSATGSYNSAFTFTPTAGACCISGNCSLLTASACATASGTFLGNPSCASALSSTAYNSTDAFPINIPDNIPAGVNSTITIAGSGSTIDADGIAVTVGLTHSWAGDIFMTISNGTVTADLVRRIGGGTVGDSSNLGGTYAFYDQSTNNIWTVAAALAGTDDVIPSDNYFASDIAGAQVNLGTAFTGQPLDGTWTLNVSDNAGIDTGSISSFRVQLAKFAGLCPTGPTPCQLADFNDVDGVTADDIFAFLDAWFAQNGVCVSPATCTADINGVDDVTADDIFAFLDLWFTFNGTNPCP